LAAVGSLPSISTATWAASPLARVRAKPAGITTATRAEFASNAASTWAIVPPCATTSKKVDASYRST
jgi:hypothetical protein